MPLRERLAGLLVGTAVGDALGLPTEGLFRERIQRKWNGVWKHRLLFGRGMCSDDTEHAFFVAQALLACGNDVAAFQKSLAWKLRFWLLGLPAGVGFATLRAIIKLWLGFSPARSGVYSAGNGPVMRSAIIGAYFADQPEQRRKFVAASTRITHTDPKAETAALAVAEAAARVINQDEAADQWLTRLQTISPDEEWRDTCQRITESYAAGKSIQEFADLLGLSNGVSGYAYHTVPVALYAVLRHASGFREAMVAVLNCGGDTDSTGAVVGALCGAAVGVAQIPDSWREGIWEWPRTLLLLNVVAERLAEQKETENSPGPVRYFLPGVIPRNILFAIVVLVHGFLRLVR